MPSVHKTLLVPFATQQMYDLVNDIEAYPKFLPWCKNAVIHSRAETQLEATLFIGKGLMQQSISTINTMVPNAQIRMQYKAGPFKYCLGAWDFASVEENNKCQVTFNINYEFSSILKAMALEPLFNPITTTMIEAFYQRAHELYAK